MEVEYPINSCCLSCQLHLFWSNLLHIKKSQWQRIRHFLIFPFWFCFSFCFFFNSILFSIFYFILFFFFFFLISFAVNSWLLLSTLSVKFCTTLHEPSRSKTFTHISPFAVYDGMISHRFWLVKKAYIFVCLFLRSFSTCCFAFHPPPMYGYVVWFSCFSHARRIRCGARLSWR